MFGSELIFLLICPKMILHFSSSCVTICLKMRNAVPCDRNAGQTNRRNERKQGLLAVRFLFRGSGLYVVEAWKMG